MYFKVFEKCLPEDSADIRREVFVDEQGFCDEFDEYDNMASHAVLYDGNEAIGTIRFYDEGGGSYHIGRVAVRKSRRGTGLGRMLVDEAEQLIALRGGSKITVGAQEDKTGFYSKCGFTKFGEPYLEQNYPHVNMAKVIK